ncbi:hypothetical protein Zmor_026972 [Zophobas morio]|uniref:Uncharacterized protein n=1 Tax=Zophobas morio TaxID=2755281 RepID=A0AA38HWV5_9CUCU|nr:hypothetical protein Zmor_026972 [Zophobas morio]
MWEGSRIAIRRYKGSSLESGDGARNGRAGHSGDASGTLRSHHVMLECPRKALMEAGELTVRLRLKLSFIMAVTCRLGVIVKNTRCIYKPYGVIRC